MRRRLSDAYETSHRLSDAYETSRHLSDAYGHIYNNNKKLSLWFLVSLKKEIHVPSDFGSKCSSVKIMVMVGVA